MEVGDIVRLKSQYRVSYQAEAAGHLAYIVGFDHDGDLKLRYLQAPIKRHDFTVDYINKWELIESSQN